MRSKADETLLLFCYLPSMSHLPANQNSACRRFNISAHTYRISVSKKSKDSRIYYGSCEHEFKSRYNNHTYSFRHLHKSSATELSKFYWSSVNRGFNPTVKWSIKKKSTPYQIGRRRCNLCLDEKFIILTTERDENLLNKRSEIISKCRHKNKFKLKNMASLVTFYVNPNYFVYDVIVMVYLK